MCCSCSSQLAGSGRSSLSSISARSVLPAKIASTMTGVSSARRKILLTYDLPIGDLRDRGVDAGI
jgi:hypothetical protein